MELELENQSYIKYFDVFLKSIYLSHYYLSH
jgi:hypothetical protein